MRAYGRHNDDGGDATESATSQRQPPPSWTRSGSSSRSLVPEPNTDTNVQESKAMGSIPSVPQPPVNPVQIARVAVHRLSDFAHTGGAPRDLFVSLADVLAMGLPNPLSSDGRWSA